MKFVTMTQEFHRSLRTALGSQLVPFAPLKELLPIPMVLFPEDEFTSLARGLGQILSAQQTILRALRQTHTETELLERFCVPQRVWRFVDWKALDAGANVIGRADIIPTRSGEFMICELNIGPAVDGHQFHDYCDPVLRAFGMSTSDLKQGQSTYAELGALISARCAAEGRHRVVLLDLDSHKPIGPLVYEGMKHALDAYCEGLEVHLVKNSQYRAEWLEPGDGRKTLVYRLFLQEELGDAEWQLFEQIVDSGAFLLNTFENYILDSKGWFPLFFDRRYRDFLTGDERAAIDALVPPTYAISADSLETLLMAKDGLVFKLSQGCEGKAVLIGSEHLRDELRARLEQRPHEWIAQELVEPLAPELPQTHWSQEVPQNMVLGLYHVDGRYSGFLVRCRANSRVVNLASVGKGGWALRVTGDEYRTMLERLAAVA
jgi:hypothetical protein